MLRQDPVSRDPIRLLRYTPFGAGQVAMSLTSVVLELATTDEWPQNDDEVVKGELDDEEVEEVGEEIGEEKVIDGKRYEGEMICPRKPEGQFIYTEVLGF